MNIKDLKEMGYHVNVTHYREYPEECLGDLSESVCIDMHAGKNIETIRYVPVYSVPKEHHKYVFPCGGITKVVISDKNGKKYFGEARCSSFENFSKKLGTTIAIGRALYGSKRSNKMDV